MIKVKTRKILLLPGDGIGPEVVREVKKIIEWFNKTKPIFDNSIFIKYYIDYPRDKLLNKINSRVEEMFKLGAIKEVKKFNMVFVPASEKGDENDYTGLVNIVNKLTGFEIKFIKVTDYNAAVEAMRANRAQIAW